MDTLEWDPLSEEVDQSCSGRDNGLLGDFICPTCGDESPNFETHQIHAEICNQVKSGKFKSPLSIEELVNLRLKIDANKVSKPSTRIISKGNSVISHSKKKFTCFKMKCGKEFERAGDLRAHEMKHIEKTDSRMVQTNLIAKEVEKVEKPTPFHCPFCVRKFSDATECEKHIPIHTQTFQCTLCPKNFNSKLELKRHLLTHTKEKPFKCTQCPKGFNEKSTLKLHVKSVHDNYRPFQCEHCPKAFTQKIALTKHVRLHTGDLPFQCQYCPKQFATKQQQTQHERIHTGEKPYQCNQCGKGFISKQGREVHERGHTGEKPYQCQFCAKRFTTKAQCRMHAESKSRCPKSTIHKD